MTRAITDTHPEAEAVHLRLLREAGLERRFALTCSLTQSALEASRAALRRQYPDESPQERRLRFITLCYGEELAQRVRADLAMRGS